MLQFLWSLLTKFTSCRVIPGNPRDMPNRSVQFRTKRIHIRDYVTIVDRIARDPFLWLQHHTVRKTRLINNKLYKNVYIDIDIYLPETFAICKALEIRVSGLRWILLPCCLSSSLYLLCKIWLAANHKYIFSSVTSERSKFVTWHQRQQQKPHIFWEGRKKGEQKFTRQRGSKKTTRK